MRDIEAMKHGRGKDMIIFGSGSIVSQLTTVRTHNTSRCITPRDVRKKA